jgi:hypothetical protein
VLPAAAGSSGAQQQDTAQLAGWAASTERLSQLCLRIISDSGNSLQSPPRSLPCELEQPVLMTSSRLAGAAGACDAPDAMPGAALAPWPSQCSSLIAAARAELQHFAAAATPHSEPGTLVLAPSGSSIALSRFDITAGQQQQQQQQPGLGGALAEHAQHLVTAAAAAMLPVIGHQAGCAPASTLLLEVPALPPAPHTSSLCNELLQEALREAAAAAAAGSGAISWALGLKAPFSFEELLAKDMQLEEGCQHLPLVLLVHDSNQVCR